MDVQWRNLPWGDDGWTGPALREKTPNGKTVIFAAHLESLDSAGYGIFPYLATSRKRNKVAYERSGKNDLTESSWPYSAHLALSGINSILHGSWRRFYYEDAEGGEYRIPNTGRVRLIVEAEDGYRFSGYSKALLRKGFQIIPAFHKESYSLALAYELRSN